MRTIIVDDFGYKTSVCLSDWDEEHNPYFVSWTEIYGKTISRWDRNMVSRFDARWDHVHKYGFAVPTEEALNLILSFTKRIVEIGAGLGYWSMLLTKKGADVVAYDTYEHGYGFKPENETFKPVWFPVEKNDHRSVDTHADRALLMVWPDWDQNWTDDTLERYGGAILIYVGEDRGCTGSERFADLIERDWEEIATCKIPNWEGIHDRLWIFRRRPVPTDHPVPAPAPTTKGEIRCPLFDAMKTGEGLQEILGWAPEHTRKLEEILKACREGRMSLDVRNEIVLHSLGECRGSSFLPTPNTWMATLDCLDGRTADRQVLSAGGASLEECLLHLVGG